MSASEQLEAINRRSAELVAHADEIFLGPICRNLAEEGIVFSTWNELDDDDREWATVEFRNRIFPVLTPLAVDPGHPFPYISSLSLNLGVIVRDPTTDQRRFARVKVPSLLPRFVVMPDGERFLPLEQVIAHHLDELFPGMDVVDHVAFRVTRNADLTVEEEEADDLLAAIEMELRRRRFGKAVRLQVEDDISAEALELIRDELELTDDDVSAHAAPLDLGGLFAVADADRLVALVMRERGYPVEDFDSRAADISVDHPDVVENYRSAHSIHLAQERADVGTERQREAFVHYRALFDKLLTTDQHPTVEDKAKEKQA